MSGKPFDLAPNGCWELVALAFHDNILTLNGLSNRKILPAAREGCRLQLSFDIKQFDRVERSPLRAKRRLGDSAQDCSLREKVACPALVFGQT